MNLIAAVSAEWGIGLNNRLLFSIPTDMKFFRSMTSGKTVIMGKNTLMSFPKQKPLPNRRNILMSTTITPEGLTVCGSIKDALEAVKHEPTEDVFIIGGEQIYKAFLPYCDTAYITCVKSSAKADAFFPDLDKSPEWQLVEESEPVFENGQEFTFRRYIRL